MFDSKSVFLGITPTGWTNDDFPGLGEDIPFEQCVSEMALAGYQGCSVGHKYPRDPKTLKAALELRGLRVSEPWASTFFLAADMEERTLADFKEQLNFIKTMGGTDVVVAEQTGAVHQRPVSLLPNRPIMTGAQWKTLTKGLNKLGKIAKDAGMTLCYHHHLGTVVQSRADVDRLMAETDPSLDVEGWDTANKLVIIANSFLGVQVTLADVTVQGITGVTAEDLHAARMQGNTIKLVARAERQEGGSYQLAVKPTLVPLDSFLGQCDGWEMGIELQSDLYGLMYHKIWEREPLPTAAAMLRDAVNLLSRPPVLLPALR
jgi:hypothetical protein